MLAAQASAGVSGKGSFGRETKYLQVVLWFKPETTPYHYFSLP